MACSLRREAVISRIKIQGQTSGIYLYILEDQGTQVSVGVECHKSHCYNLSNATANQVVGLSHTWSGWSWLFVNTVDNIRKLGVLDQGRQGGWRTGWRHRRAGGGGKMS